MPRMISSERNEIKRFVITGCGRSGTTYMARIMSEIGCFCVHEKYFLGIRRHGKIIIPENFPLSFKFNKITWKMPPYGEAAWEAVPFLKYLPRGTVIFHLVRNPIKFIRSRKKKGLDHIFSFMDKYCPINIPDSHNLTFSELSNEKQVNYISEHWIRWNKEVAKFEHIKKYKYYRIKIEDINVNLLERMLRSINFKYNQEKIISSYNSIPRNIHSRGKTDENITLNNIQSSIREKVIELALEYGYELDHLE